MSFNLGSLVAYLGVDTRNLRSGLGNATNDLRSFESKLNSTIGTLAKLTIGIYSLHQAVQLSKDVLLMAARYETLGITMNVVGRNAGYSASQMSEFQRELEKTGIAAIEARGTLARMAQAQIDLAKSSQLARVAQDAAVIGNMNSSESFEHMIYGIQSANVRVLRTIGINVSFERSYQKIATQLRKTTDELTELEKVQARTNAVLEAGERIAGTYEAAMTTAGKQINSFQRYIDNLKVSAGEAFQTGLAVSVNAATEAIKNLSVAVENSREVLDSIAEFSFKSLVNILELTTKGVIYAAAGFKVFESSVSHTLAFVMGAWAQFKSLEAKMEKMNATLTMDKKRHEEAEALEKEAEMLDMVAKGHYLNAQETLTQIPIMTELIDNINKTSEAWEKYYDKMINEKKAEEAKALFKKMNPGAFWEWRVANPYESWSRPELDVDPVAEEAAMIRRLEENLVLTRELEKEEKKRKEISEQYYFIRYKNDMALKRFDEERLTALQKMRQTYAQLADQLEGEDLRTLEAKILLIEAQATQLKKMAEEEIKGLVDPREYEAFLQIIEDASLAQAERVKRETIRKNGTMLQTMGVAWKDFIDEQGNASLMMYNFWTNSYDNMQRTISSIFFDAMKNDWDDLKDVVKDFVDYTRNSILKLIADLAAQELILNFGAKLVGSFTGSLASSALGSYFGGLFGGGAASAAAPITQGAFWESTAVAGAGGGAAVGASSLAIPALTAAGVIGTAALASHLKDQGANKHLVNAGVAGLGLGMGALGLATPWTAALGLALEAYDTYAYYRDKRKYKHAGYWTTSFDIDPTTGEVTGSGISLPGSSYEGLVSQTLTEAVQGVLGEFPEWLRTSYKPQLEEFFSAIEGETFTIFSRRYRDQTENFEELSAQIAESLVPNLEEALAYYEEIAAKAGELFRESLSTALQETTKSAGWFTFKDGLESMLKNIMFETMVNSLIQSPLIQQILGPTLDRISEKASQISTKTGGPSWLRGYTVDKFTKDMEREIANFERNLESLHPLFDSLFGVFKDFFDTGEQEVISASDAISSWMLPVMESWRNFMDEMTISSLAPAVSSGAYEARYRNLLERAGTGDVKAAQDLFSFVRSDYLPFMQKYTATEGGYKEVWDRMFGPEGELSNFDFSVDLSGQEGMSQAVADAISDVLVPIFQEMGGDFQFNLQMNGNTVAEALIEVLLVNPRAVDRIREVLLNG